MHNIIFTIKDLIGKYGSGEKRTIKCTTCDYEKKSTQVEHTSQRVALSWFIVRMKNLFVLIVMRSMVIF